MGYRARLCPGDSGFDLCGTQPIARYRIWVGVHCRFVPNCFPPLLTTKQGGEYIPSPEEVASLPGGLLSARGVLRGRAIGSDGSESVSDGTSDALLID